MGGGDLNQKKSWHPNTFKNQERVWKAEQVEAAEKRKLAELQAEISAERDREDLRRVGQASGIIANDNGHKLEWMYRGAKDNVNREDYLLGRTVDKTYEQFAEEEREQEKQDHLGVSKPKNHVEYECVPFSIRAYKDADPTTVQVDMARKIAEDPLMMIKQREMESRKKLLENPVKLKELKQLLQSERSSKSGKRKDSKKKSKKEKKEKKSKKKGKKKRSRSKSSGSESGSDSDNDVDNALLAMLSKQKAVMEDEVNMEDMNLEEVVNLKYDTLNKELDKMIKGSDEEQEDQQQERNRRGGDQRMAGRRYDEDSRDDRRINAQRRQRSMSRDRNQRRGPSPDRRRRDRERSPLDDRRRGGRDDGPRHRERNQRSRSPDQRRRDVRPRSRDRERERRQESSSQRKESSRRRSPPPSVEKPTKHRKRSLSPKRKTPDREEKKPSPQHDSRENYTPPPRNVSSKQRVDEDSDDERNKKSAANRNYGLVTAAGESIALKNSPKSYTDRKATQAKDSYKSSESSWKKTSSSSRPKLTDEEKAEKLREMMQNAEWRDKERESYVRKYHEDGRKEEDKHREEEFDRNFIHKELHKSAQNETVESRLKSNRNNIQRSSGAMNTNFARR